MVFSSILFMFIYLPVVLFLYYISPVKWRNPILFVANMIFYGWGEPVYIILMLVSLTINYINGILIGKWRHVDDKKAKTVLVVNVVLNLALLGFFKYYNLFAETLNMIPFINLPDLNVTLPIGISFYTFQTMSYPIDAVSYTHLRVLARAGHRRAPARGSGVYRCVSGEVSRGPRIHGTGYCRC